MVGEERLRITFRIRSFEQENGPKKYADLEHKEEGDRCSDQDKEEGEKVQHGGGQTT